MNFKSRINLELKTFFGSILIITLIWGGIKAYTDQAFICDKTKDTCYYTTFGIKNINNVKISELEGITIKPGFVTVNRLSYSYGTVHKTYMPTLITKSGKTYPFYRSPTRNSHKAEQDKNDFSKFMKSNETTLKLKNIDNFYGSI